MKQKKARDDGRGVSTRRQGRVFKHNLTSSCLIYMDYIFLNVFRTFKRSLLALMREKCVFRFLYIFKLEDGFFCYFWKSLSFKVFSETESF